MKDQNSDFADFIFETGILAAFKRSGFDFLGSSSQNIASHSFRTSIIGYMLASFTEGADVAKTVFLCLFHDIPETRTGDINYFQKKYVKKDEGKAIEDICGGLGKLAHIGDYINEFNEKKSKESIIACDADVLELIFTLKEEQDKGNEQAAIWIENAMKRLETETAKDLANAGLGRKYYDWWQKA